MTSILERKMEIPELEQHIGKYIQGVFGQGDMAILKEEIEKLNSGELYLEIGVDEGKSFTTAFHYAKQGVFIIGIDIHDVEPAEKSIGRGTWMEQEKMIGIEKRGFFIHGDADELAAIWQYPISLLFIDGHHDYESVKKNTETWLPKVKKGGTILFHDYDYPDVKKWLDEKFQHFKDIFHGKMVKVKIDG